MFWLDFIFNGGALIDYMYYELMFSCTQVRFSFGWYDKLQVCVQWELCTMDT